MSYLKQRPKKTLLTELYKRKSVPQISAMYNVAINTVYRWLRHHGIPAKGVKGVNNPHSKLSNDQVREIRAVAGLETHAVTAAAYGVSTATISHIQTGKTRKDIL